MKGEIICGANEEIVLEQLEIRHQRKLRMSANYTLTAFLTAIGYFCVLFTWINLREKTNLAQSGGILGFFLGNATVFYVSSLFLLAMIFFAMRFISGFIPNKFSGITENRILSDKPRILIFVFITFTLGVMLLRRFFVSEIGEFGANQEQFFSHKVHSGTIVILFLLFLGAGKLCKKITLPDGIVYAGNLIALIISYYSLVFTDPLTADSHHSTAFFESIVNVFYGVPYDSVTTGIYGHYGLFYKPLLFIFGETVDALVCITAFFGTLSTLMFIYICHSLTENRFIRIIAPFASLLTLATMRTTCYWQIHPLRILFPMIIVAYFTYLAKNRNFSFKSEIIGYLICALGIVWNTETGLFCLASITLGFAGSELQKNNWYEKPALKHIAKLVAMACASVLLAVAIVNVYNLFSGGKLIFTEFFFPLFNSSYINVLTYVMPIGNHAWIYTIILFLCILFLGLYSTTLFRQGSETQYDVFAPVMITLASVSLLNFSYYANRAVYFNLDIIIQPACLCMVILCSKFSPVISTVLKEKISFRRVVCLSLSAISYFTLVFMSSQIVFSKEALEDKKELGWLERNRMSAYTDVIEQNIPENTFAFGSGINLIYFELGWQNGGYYRDFSDLYISGNDVEEKIIEDTLKHDTFLAGDANFVDKIIERDNRYVKLKEVTLPNGIVYSYYSRI